MGYVTPAQRYDVVTVGDVATDVIIRVPEGQVGMKTEEDGRFLEVPLGVKVAYHEETTVAAGGSAANIAVGLSRLGIRVGLASFLAHDEVGRDLLSALHGEHVDTRLIRVDSPAHTNRNIVLSYRGERTIFVWHADFEYHWPYLRPSEVPAWLLVTSLGPDAIEYEGQIADWLDENPEVKLALRPGTVQIDGGVKRLARLCRRAELFVCDAHQARSLIGVGSDAPDKQLAALRKLGPRLVAIVDDAGGAVALEDTDRFRVSDGTGFGSALDRTGAADAFAASLLAGVVRGLPLKDALKWGPPNYSSVAAYLGSQAGLLREVDLRRIIDSFGVTVNPVRD
ncbi:MAG: carbohydrate kinase family protein [Acidimicrobiales bacterium]